MTHVIIQQIQLFHQISWPNVSIMGIIERLFVQQNIMVTTTQPTVEIALICAYC
jgi:hypothetical protein